MKLKYRRSLALHYKKIENPYFFRVTRDADLELRAIEADDLMSALEQGLRKRRIGGEVVRLEVSEKMPPTVLNLLMEGMAVHDFLIPDRIVIGGLDKKSINIMKYFIY